MRFLVDECTGPSVARWLQDQDHEVFSVFDEARGVDDDTILQEALEERWILITDDKDFGDRVYRDGRVHRGYRKASAIREKVKKSDSPETTKVPTARRKGS